MTAKVKILNLPLFSHVLSPVPPTPEHIYQPGPDDDEVQSG